MSNSDTLTVLNLAGNEKLGNKAMEALSSVIRQGKAWTVHTLNLSACGITSPLEEETLRALRTLPIGVTEGTGLKELDLSHNSLSLEDKQQLVEEWDMCSEGKSLSRIEGTLCVLCLSLS